jgi:hypothetical protein
MASYYVCPNGHDVELVVMRNCTELGCHALVAYEPVAHGMQLHEQLAQYERFAAQRDRVHRRLIAFLVLLVVAQAVLLTIVVA